MGPALCCANTRTLAWHEHLYAYRVGGQHTCTYIGYSSHSFIVYIHEGCSFNFFADARLGTAPGFCCIPVQAIQKLRGLIYILGSTSLGLCSCQGPIIPSLRELHLWLLACTIRYAPPSVWDEVKFLCLLEYFLRSYACPGVWGQVFVLA